MRPILASIVFVFVQALVWAGESAQSPVPLESVQGRTWAMLQTVRVAQGRSPDCTKECQEYITAYGLSAFHRRKLPELVRRAAAEVPAVDASECKLLPEHARFLGQWQTALCKGVPSPGNTDSLGRAVEGWLLVASHCDRSGTEGVRDMAALYIANLVSLEAANAFRPATLVAPSCPKPRPLHGDLLPAGVRQAVAEGAFESRVQSPVSNAVASGRLVAVDVVSGAQARALDLAACIAQATCIRDQLQQVMDYRPRMDLQDDGKALLLTSGKLAAVAKRILNGRAERPDDSAGMREVGSTPVPQTLADSVASPEAYGHRLVAQPYIAKAVSGLGAGPSSQMAGLPDSVRAAVRRFDSLFISLVAAEFDGKLNCSGARTALVETTTIVQKAQADLVAEIRAMSIYVEGNAQDITNASKVKDALVELQDRLKKGAEAFGEATACLELGTAGTPPPAKWLGAVAETQMTLQGEATRLCILLDQVKVSQTARVGLDRQ